MSSALRDNNKAGVTPERFALSPLRAFWEKVDNCPKPTIAAINGVCGGGGCELALACDIRIAATSAFITTAFRNIGFSGDYGGSWLLTQLVGPARAKDLYYTARRVHSEEALQMGIFNQVVADETLASATQELAQQIAAGPPIALGYMKENINRALLKTKEIENSM